jgi:hypothetical protein
MISNQNSRKNEEYIYKRINKRWLKTYQTQAICITSELYNSYLSQLLKDRSWPLFIFFAKSIFDELTMLDMK